MKICKNPECNKEIPDGMNYCNENCLRRHQQIKEETRTNPETKQIDETTIAPNTGTQNKNSLQIQAIRFLRSYPKKQTLKEYACWLCWDLNVTQRTAMESYIEPMVIRGVLVKNTDGTYSLNPKYE